MFCQNYWINQSEGLYFWLTMNNYDHNSSGGNCANSNINRTKKMLIITNIITLGLKMMEKETVVIAVILVVTFVEIES